MVHGDAGAGGPAVCLSPATVALEPKHAPARAVAKLVAAAVVQGAAATAHHAPPRATRHHHQLCGLVSASQQWPLVRREAVSASLLSSPSLLLMAAVTRN